MMGHVAVVVAPDGTETVIRPRPGQSPMGYAAALRVGSDALDAGAQCVLVAQVYTVLTREGRR